MSITLNLPEDLEREFVALAQQYGSPEAALAELIERCRGGRDQTAAATVETTDAKSPSHDADWWRELDAIARPCGGQADVSRASFYPDAGK